MDVEAVARFVADSTALGADLSGLALRLAALAADAQGLLAAADRMKADRARLDEERRVFEAERAELEAQGRDWVVLDVGGTHFATTRHTLAKVPGSMLAAWFSGRHAVNPRPDGTVFIDRSPALFAYVLDFLRAGVQMQRWRQDEGEEEALRDEFDYFVLPWPKEDPESVVEAFGGELECVEMKGMIADLAWVDLNGTRALGGTVTDGEDFGALLWDTCTGSVLSTWLSVEGGIERLHSVTLGGAYVCAVYEDAELGLCTRAVLHSSDDSSCVQTIPVEQPYPRSDNIVFTIIGSCLMIVRKETVTAWNIVSGARLWVADNMQFRGHSIEVNYNDEVCICFSTNACAVMDIATGQTIYQIMGLEDDRYSRDCFPVGRTVRLITRNPGASGWHFRCVDEKGEYAIPYPHGTFSGNSHCRANRRSKILQRRRYRRTHQKHFSNVPPVFPKSISCGGCRVSHPSIGG